MLAWQAKGRNHSAAAAADPPTADLVFAERYRAMSSSDARFDGQFITDVHTTGI